MKILVSAYACNPYQGSELALGWNWLRELNNFNQITALTSHTNKKDIENFIYENPNSMENVNFIYVDVPHSSWHVGYKFEHIYYILWQNQALKVAKKILKNEHFDLVHHITYATCILPTKMHKLNLPFLYGPVGGGENIPSIIKYPMKISNRITEIIRACVKFFFRLTPNFKKTIKKASLILTTTEETKLIIPKKYQKKVEIFQGIGLSKDFFLPEPSPKENSIPKFLITGRMLYWKGFEMAIKAFLNALNTGFKAELVVLGSTENNKKYIKFQNHLKSLCKNNLDKEIKFMNNIDHNKMKFFYDQFDVFINCSLRDSGCFCVMEAMSRALPSIVVNTGGPKINTISSTSIKISPAPFDIMVREITDAIILLGNNKDLRNKMGKEAREFAFKEFLLKEKALKINNYYKKIINTNFKEFK